MKTSLMVFAVMAFMACNNASKNETATGADAVKSDSVNSAENISYPYTADYSSKFEMGKPEHAANILAIWKAWDDGDLSKAKDMFADTVTMYFSNGDMVHGARDTVAAMGQKARDMFASSKSEVQAWMSLKSTDRNENWVTIWGKETDTDKKGKIDSMQLQETWRLNNDGKADLVYQYKMTLKPAKK